MATQVVTNLKTLSCIYAILFVYSQPATYIIAFDNFRYPDNQHL